MSVVCDTDYQIDVYLHQPLLFLLVRMVSGISRARELHFATCKGNPENFCSCNPQSWALESRIQLKESEIPLTFRIRNPYSNDKEWNPVPKAGIHGVESRIQDPRSLTWGGSWVNRHERLPRSQKVYFTTFLVAAFDIFLLLRQ